MKHLALLVVKFISCLIAFTVALDLFFDATLVDIVSFSLLVTVISYIFGDRIILPRIGRNAATITDFLLTYMSVWIFGNILLDNYIQIAWGSILSALIVTAAEVFVHHYIINNFEEEKRESARQETSFNNRLSYGTEFAEEHEKDD